MKIKLKHLALNVDFQCFENLTIKLVYSFPNLKKPKLQFFENTIEAQENEWSIYGLPPDKESELGIILEFNQLNETGLISMRGKNYEIEFTNLGQEKYNYPKGSEEINFYEFIVLDTDRFKPKN